MMSKLLPELSFPSRQETSLNNEIEKSLQIKQWQDYYTAETASHIDEKACIL